MRCFLRVGLWIGLLGLWVGSPMRAHVTDTSLLRVQITSDRIGVDWNADLLTLEKIRALPRQGDGGVQRQAWEREAGGFVEWIRSKLELSVDGAASDLGASEGARWELEGESVGATALQSAHVNFRFVRERTQDGGHVRISARELLSALGDQHQLIVAFVQGADSEQAVLNRQFPAIEYTASLGKQAEGGWGRLFRLGVDHILSGYDHLLFLATLLVAVGGWSRLVGIITAFTVAHGVTLTLSALGWLELPSKAVECVIALSIAWVALENLLERRVAPREALTFGFGLVHGLGFAGAVRELDLPREGLLRSVLGFNLGVEAGQLLFVALVFPVLRSLRAGPWEARTRKGLSGAACVLALGWLVQRALQ